MAIPLLLMRSRRRREHPDILLRDMSLQRAQLKLPKSSLQAFYLGFLCRFRELIASR
jgi:hypothetical protein